MDEKFMKEALKEARKGLGRTSPNPAVGAVVVREGEIVSRGYHKGAGQPHAEIEALSRIGRNAKGTTLYVTLEPCNHYGKTPPCTETILESGVKRVVAGMEDPNPGVSGGGCDFLRSKGIEVSMGILERECRELNEAFLKFVMTKRPFVMLKCALTLDGWMATRSGNSKWITSKKSRNFVHKLRDQVDSIMIGVGTLMEDDPELTTRLKSGTGKDPMRIVLDTHLKTPPTAKILLVGSPAGSLFVVGPEIDPLKKREMKEKGALIAVCPLKEGRIDLGAMLDILGKMNVTSVLLEGGADLIGSMVKERLIDKYYLFLGPKILGGDDGVPMASGKGPDKMDECLRLKDIRIKKFGDDILISGYPVM